MLKDVVHLLFSELEQPLASAGSVEALPPAPLVWLIFEKDLLIVLTIVGYPIHPPTDVNV